MERGLQTVNQQRKLSEWAERVTACRSSGQSVNKWQRRLYELAQKQQENRFAEITPQAKSRSDIAVTVQIGGAELAIHNNADAATVEAVLRAVKSC